MLFEILAKTNGAEGSFRRVSKEAEGAAGSFDRLGKAAFGITAVFAAFAVNAAVKFESAITTLKVLSVQRESAPARLSALSRTRRSWRRSATPTLRRQRRRSLVFSRRTSKVSRTRRMLPLS
jgi:hypothetical protein